MTTDQADKAREYRKHALQFVALHRGAYLAKVVAGLLTQIDSYEEELGVAQIDGQAESGASTVESVCEELECCRCIQLLKADLERVTGELASARRQNDQHLQIEEGYLTELHAALAERDAMREVMDTAAKVRLEQALANLRKAAADAEEGK